MSANHQQVQYAGFPRRFGAWIVDSIILGIIAQIMLEILDKTDSLSLGLLLNAILVGFLYFYHVYLIHKYGRTAGKAIAGIEVVGLDGKRIAQKQAFMRVSPYILLFLVPVLLSLLPVIFPALETSVLLLGLLLVLQIAGALWYVVSAIILARNPRRRTIHDFIAKTMVVQRIAEKKVTVPPVS